MLIDHGQYGLSVFVLLNVIILQIASQKRVLSAPHLHGETEEDFILRMDHPPDRRSLPPWIASEGLERYISVMKITTYWEDNGDGNVKMT